MLKNLLNRLYSFPPGMLGMTIRMAAIVKDIGTAQQRLLEKLGEWTAYVAHTNHVLEVNTKDLLSLRWPA